VTVDSDDTPAGSTVTVDSGWHPSHLETFDVHSKQTRIILFRHNRDCAMHTNLTLADDKQVRAPPIRYDTRHEMLFERALNGRHKSAQSAAEGPGFRSQSRRCRVTVLGKLLTPIVFTKQRNW